jgi:hypothetical protein
MLVSEILRLVVMLPLLLLSALSRLVVLPSLAIAESLEPTSYLLTPLLRATDEDGTSGEMEDVDAVDVL